jgi:2,3-bisphosphoglycerate-dependent phosphoglycerate mutase
MELLIIRHGQSMGEVEERHEGRADFPLSPLGFEQAEKTARFLYRNYPLDRIYTSPLVRARSTAEAIAGPLQQQIQLCDALTDRDNGKLAGMLRSEALEKFPYPTHGRPYYEALFGGESELTQRNRVEHFFARLCSETPARRIGLVTHSSTINMLFRVFLSLNNPCNIYLSTSEAGIHFWHLNDKFRQIIFNNHRAHLDEAL